MKIIFLDIDGVLNAYRPKDLLLWRVLERFRLYRFLTRNYDVFGIRTLRVFVLWYIVKKTNAKLVLSSSWRGGYFRPYDEKSERQQELERKLKLFNLEIMDKTPASIPNESRGHEIEHWLDEHKNVERFVILDDERFNIEDMYPNNLVLTSKDSKDSKSIYEYSGLSLRHIKPVIKILNKDK